MIEVKTVGRYKVRSLHFYENASMYRNGALVTEGSGLNTQPNYVPRDKPIVLFKTTHPDWILLVCGENLDQFLGILITAKTLETEITLTVIETGGSWVGKCTGIVMH
ncbi:MAG: hypothetical protein F6J87_20805 [Spirulina sp. SIO3F2]|nr:hypothetical protein [Spirulina sp. SIO3F2]